MGIFFNTFFKVLATLLALLLFVVIFAIILFYSGYENNSEYKLIKGIEESNNRIVVLELEGPIIRDSSNFVSFAAFNIVTPTNFKNKLDNLNILSPDILIISINSPGGTVAASYEIYEILKNFKEQNNIEIYIHTNESIFSGAYWFALAGDKIYASYGSLIGSIGVKGPDWLYFDEPVALSSGLLGNSIETKNGIIIYSQNAGKSKDLLNPFRKPTDEELNQLQNIVNNIYEDFVLEVSNKRKIENTTIKTEIGAMIYDSKNAKDNFLIDDVLNLDSLINNLVKKNKYNDYQVYKTVNNNFSLLDKYIFNLFKNEEYISQLTLKQFICNKLKVNISSVSNSYLSNC